MGFCKMTHTQWEDFVWKALGGFVVVMMVSLAAIVIRVAYDVCVSGVPK